MIVSTPVPARVVSRAAVLLFQAVTTVILLPLAALTFWFAAYVFLAVVLGHCTFGRGCDWGDWDPWFFVAYTLGLVMVSALYAYAAAAVWVPVVPFRKTSVALSWTTLVALLAYSNL